MSLLVPPAFLAKLQNRFPPGSKLSNPYAYVAGIVLAAHNRPADVAATYSHFIRSAAAAGEERETSTSRFREALFKTGVLYGAPRMINALLEVSKVVPASERDTGPWRDSTLHPAAMQQRGEALFKETYGSAAPEVRQLLKDIHPDFDYFCMTLIYGPVYAFDSILGPAETSLAMIAALVAIQAPLQVRWHLDGAIRNGASRQDVDAVVSIAEAVLERVHAEQRRRGGSPLWWVALLLLAVGFLCVFLVAGGRVEWPYAYGGVLHGWKRLEIWSGVDVDVE